MPYKVRTDQEGFDMFQQAALPHISAIARYLGQGTEVDFGELKIEHEERSTPRTMESEWVDIDTLENTDGKAQKFDKQYDNKRIHGTLPKLETYTVQRKEIGEGVLSVREIVVSLSFRVSDRFSVENTDAFRRLMIEGGRDHTKIGSLICEHVIWLLDPTNRTIILEDSGKTGAEYRVLNAKGNVVKRWLTIEDA
ncbi:hypothetical protein F4212_01400 [Candidatus Poribacteria bacterium]|nr:hypothetical protein [Candidatus Poribacteria bacterium]